MSFVTTAIRGLITPEKSEPPACRWFIFWGMEKVMEKKQGGHHA